MSVIMSRSGDTNNIRPSICRALQELDIRGTANLLTMQEQKSRYELIDKEHRVVLRKQPHYAETLRTAVAANDTTIQVPKNSRTDNALVPGRDLLITYTRINSAGITVAISTGVNRITEVARISSVNTSATTHNVITLANGLSRAFPAHNAAASANFEQVVVSAVGSSYEENSTAPSEYSNTEYSYLNTAQIFRTGFGISDTAKALQSFTDTNPRSLADNIMQATKNHSADIERAILFGEKTASSVDHRRMDGFASIIKTQAPDNYIQPSTSYSSFVDLQEVIDIVFEVGTEGSAMDMRYLFTGNAGLNTLRKLIDNNSNATVNWENIPSEFGFNVAKINTNMGSFMVKSHPLMTNDPTRQHDMLIVDPMGYYLNFMQNRDGNLRVHARTGRDGDTGDITTECTLVVMNPEGCMYLENVHASNS